MALLLALPLFALMLVVAGAILYGLLPIAVLIVFVAVLGIFFPRTSWRR